MKKTAAWTLALAFMGVASRAQDEWPRDLDQVEVMVESVVGDIAYDRVNVRRRGKAVEVSIGLENLPAELRAVAQKGADEDAVFLATNFVQPFMDDPQVAEFALMPVNAHLVDHFFGFWVFNFGKRVKLPAEINVIGQDDQSANVKFRKKNFKVHKRTLTMKFVEGQVSAPGLYALQTVVGPYSLTTYFCNSC